MLLKQKCIGVANGRVSVANNSTVYSVDIVARRTDSDTVKDMSQSIIDHNSGTM